MSSATFVLSVPPLIDRSEPFYPHRPEPLSAATAAGKNLLQVAYAEIWAAPPDDRHRVNPTLEPAGTTPYDEQGADLDQVSEFQAVERNDTVYRFPLPGIPALTGTGCAVVLTG